MITMEMLTMIIDITHDGGIRPPGSGSVSQRYGSGSFHNEAKILRKTWISTALWLLTDFLAMKNDVNVTLTDPDTDPALFGSLLFRQKYGSEDPDPYQMTWIRNTGGRCIYRCIWFTALKYDQWQQWWLRWQWQCQLKWLLCSVVEPEWFFSDPIPDPDPTFQRVSDLVPDPDPNPDPDPVWIWIHTYIHTHIYIYNCMWYECDTGFVLIVYIIVIGTYKQ